MDLRFTARQIFAEALQRVELRTLLHGKLRTEGAHLHIGGTTYDLAHFRDIRLVALGKAALPMSEALLERLNPALTRTQTLTGIVLGTALPAIPDPRLTYRLGAHPFPDQTSAEAAQAILDRLANTTRDTLVFFLISGGASAMADLPLDSTVPLPDLIVFHGILIHSGLTIAEMNTLRKHISAIKGGRLALAAHPASQCTLLVSDVPPTHPDIIASGPTLPDPTTLHDCRQLLATTLAQTPIPPSIHNLLHNPNTPETPKPNHPAFAHTTHHTLLSSDDLAQAALTAAAARGFHATIDNTPDDWPFDRAATYLLNRLETLAQANPHQPTCLISTGELTVPIPPNIHPGRGGRNQQFALHCALQLAAATHPTAILSAGSDGIDGNSPAAGAVIDETTLTRATHLGLDPKQALATFNSYPLLDTLSESIDTGPTGNNLRDLRLLLRAPVLPA